MCTIHPKVVPDFLIIPYFPAYKKLKCVCAIKENT